MTKGRSSSSKHKTKERQALAKIEIALKGQCEEEVEILFKALRKYEQRKKYYNAYQKLKRMIDS